MKPRAKEIKNLRYVASEAIADTIEMLDRFRDVRLFCAERTSRYLETASLLTVTSFPSNQVRRMPGIREFYSSAGLAGYLYSVLA